MSITPQSAIQVSTASQLLVPKMAGQPLQRALENLNYLWQWHRPPLVDVCPNVDVGTDRHIFVFPAHPSGDDLPYTFEHRFIPAENTTLDITVYYTTAYHGSGGGTSWHSIYTATTPTVGAGLLGTQVDGPYVIPHDAEALRVDYQTANGNYAPHHLLVYPSPDAPVAGISTTGFTPFDDGLLAGTAGAAVHTEFLNRCKKSALTVLRDRRQQVLSFLQVESGTPWWQCIADVFGDLAVTRLFFPNQSGEVLISVSVLADVDAGATSDLVRVRQLGVNAADVQTFDADGLINTKSLKLQLQPDGLRSYADVAIGGLHSVYPNHMRLRAVSASWRPGD